MSEHDFFLWLEGFLEACPNGLSEAQVELVKKKMSQVAEKVTPHRVISLGASTIVNVPTPLSC